MIRRCGLLLLASILLCVFASSTPQHADASNTPQRADVFDFLLWPLRNASVALGHPEPYFGSSVTSAGPVDLATGSVELLRHSIKPGGVLLTSSTPETYSGLRRVAAMSPDHPPADLFRLVKLGVLSGSHVALLKKGSLDDNDHFCLGDYGNEYGEYRWGLFSRFIQRMLGPAAAPSESSGYFEEQRTIFSLPVSSVVVEFDFPHRVHQRTEPHNATEARGAHSEIIYNTRASEERVRGRAIVSTRLQLKRKLIQDLQFSLAVHAERISVVIDSSRNKLVVRFVDVSGPMVDVRFHSKQRPWRTWTSYFGEAPPQPLIVIAQTVREKSFMVADDLSDLYTGAVTAAVPEGAIKVSVTSPECSRFQRALQLHRLLCVAADSAPGAAAPTQSALYHLAAKEKLSGDLGAAAESSLKSISRKHHKPWPSLAVLHIEGDGASLELFEDRMLRRGSVQALTAKLHQGVDLVHVHSCDIPPEALQRLVPGGLVLIEGLDCVGEAAFARFVDTYRTFGAIAIGRRVGVIVKSGAYRIDARRGVWPQAKAPRPSTLEL